MTSTTGAPVTSGPGRTQPARPEKDLRLGIITGLTAYILWGFLPIFFKLVEHIDPLMVVAFRVGASLIVVAIVLAWRGQMGEVRVALRDRRAVIKLAISAVLVAINWLTFIWAVANHNVLDVSFGYFINPIVNVMLGMVLLGERLTPIKWVAVALAVCAVAIQAIGLGTIPWVALLLAFSFAFYGYVRKTVNVGSTAGLMVETLVLLPVAFGYFVLSFLIGASPTYLADPTNLILLLLTGPATAIPLMLFAFAARQLQLSSIGMIQYIAPSMGFVIAIYLFGEPLELPRLLSFALIWVSLVVFTIGSYRAIPREKRARHK